MPFTFQPLPTSTVGENLGRGIREGGASIGAALAQMGQRSKELKGYKTLLEAYAEDPQNGINKDNIDKMSLEQAKSSILAAEVRKSRAQQTQQQNSLADFFGNLDRNTTARPDTTATLARGNGPTRDMVMTQPMDLKSAIIAAASRNPALLSTDNPASKLFGNAMAAALKAPPGTPTGDPITKGNFYYGAKGWTPLPRTVTATTPTARPNPADALEPDVELMPYTPTGTKERVPGLYQKMKDGKRVGWYQETQSAPRVASTNGKTSFMDIINGAEEGGGTGKEAMGGYEIGATYSGLKYLGGDPNDEANWEK